MTPTTPDATWRTTDRTHGRQVHTLTFSYDGWPTHIGSDQLRPCIGAGPMIVCRSGLTAWWKHERRIRYAVYSACYCSEHLPDDLVGHLPDVDDDES